MGVLKSQGTELYFYLGSDSTGVKKVGCVTNISGLGGAAAQSATSCFDSVEDEFEGGRPSPGQVQISINYMESDVTLDDLITLKDSREVVPWNVSGSNGTAAPALDSDGNLATDPTRTGLRFRAYVADFTWNIADNDIWRAEITLQRSGPWLLERAGI